MCKLFCVFFSLLLSIFLVSQTVEAITCYVCNSGIEDQGGNKCLGSVLDDTLLEPCQDQGNKNATMCRKIVQWIDNDYGDGLKANERIIRSCGYEETERDCYYRAGFGGRQQVCTCRENNCNGGVSVTIGAATLLVPLVALLTSRVF